MMDIDEIAYWLVATADYLDAGNSPDDASTTVQLQRHRE